MINTDHYIRFTRVDSVVDTATGVLADLHREQLRIDVVRSDVVRIKISRGGEFDETPTYAVCIDPLAEPAVHRGPRRRSTAGDHRRLHGHARVGPVPDRRAPRRRHPGGGDGAG